jgi:hypothetical protein
MRPILICLLALAGCRGILGIPSEGRSGCPSPCRVTLSGQTVPAEKVPPIPGPLANVTVDLTSLDPSPEVLTPTEGTYSFEKLEPDTPITFTLSVAQPAPSVKGLLNTVYAAGMTDTNDHSIDLPVVQLQWLAKVAFQCGIFPSMNSALFDPGTMNLNNYFVTRSTIVGQVVDKDRNPVKLDRADISVVIDDYVNVHKNPADTDHLPAATLCFLEPDPATGEYKGVNENQTTSGRFVMFRARNELGTGSGPGEVRIPGFPTGPLDVSSGSIGFAYIRQGASEGLPARPLTFERDIYHFFKDKTCNAVCHKPPDGVAYMTAPMRPGPNGKTYPADWSASVDAVFDNLTKPFDTDCALGGDMAARVCRAMPTASLLYQKPGGLISHAGLNLGTRDEMVIAILQWIKDGAILR